MSDLVHRIKASLEPILDLSDPRERISAYHDMPYALFRYEPKEEFELRKEISLLETRLAQKGKRVSRISLAQCLDDAMRSQRPLEDWFAAEREQGTDTIVETVHQLKGRVTVPTVLFYPGDLDGAAGLRFMGVLAAEHNYRPKIF
jgi:hypothetical protein